MAARVTIRAPAVRLPLGRAARRQHEMRVATCESPARPRLGASWFEPKQAVADVAQAGASKS